MKMNKKIVIPAGVAAVLVTALVLGNIGGQLTREYVSANVAPFDVEYGTEIADVIAKGTITDVRTESTGDPDHPFVAIATLQVEEYLKNPQQSMTIEVRDVGQGIFDHPKHGKVEVVAEESSDFKAGEKVLLFLDYDEGNVLGDGYYVIGIFQGKYSLKDDGTAKNADPSKDTTQQELEQKIKNELAQKQK